MQKTRNVDHLIKDIAITSFYSVLVGIVTAAVLTLLIFAITPSASASENRGLDQLPQMTVQQVKRGSLILKLASGGQSVDAPMLKTDVEMDVSGLTARVRVHQRFTNPGQSWVEGTYVFPLPENSAVDRMRLRVGERIIEGEIKKKQEARRIYAQARREGKKASLLSQQRPNIFTTAVANIGPGETVIVEIEYQQQLSYKDGQFRLRFPMVVGPRYIPGHPLGSDDIQSFSGSGWAANTNVVPDASQITPPVIDESEGKINPVSLVINLNAGFPLARLESSYHQIESIRDEQGVHRIQLSQTEVPDDRDFELVWVPKTGSAPHAAFFREQWEGNEYGLLMLVPPSNDQESENRPPREVIYVIDTSGSMHGESIIQAKSALEMAIGRLGPTDLFNIIQFDHQTSQLFADARVANGVNRKRALRYVRSMEADGGTEMLPALEAALSGDGEPGMLRQVVFLTDGSVGNEEQLFSVIQNKLADSRLFTVGIGSAPNSYFMTRAAQFGRGTFTYIGKVEEVQEKMLALFTKLESPALTDITLSLGEGESTEIWPDKIPDLYLGETVMMALKMDSPLAQVELLGMKQGKPWRQRVKLAGGGSSPGIHLLWARSKIADLMAQKSRGRPEVEVKPAILELALAHQLVSRYTSLVAVDKTPSRPLDETMKNKQLPTNLPTGWSQQKVFGQLPQTATSAQLRLMLGSLLLLIALVMYRLAPSSRLTWWRS